MLEEGKVRSHCDQSLQPAPTLSVQILQVAGLHGIGLTADAEEGDLVPLQSRDRIADPIGGKLDFLILTLI